MAAWGWLGCGFGELLGTIRDSGASTTSVTPSVVPWEDCFAFPLRSLRELDRATAGIWD